MARAQLRRQAAQLIKALEAHGHPFLQSSKADISVSQLEEPSVLSVLHRLTALPHQLGLIREEPSLSLTKARTLYNSAILDTLCLSLLSRLQWTQFCSLLDDIAASGKGMATASRASECVYELLRVWRRVQPASDADTSVLEIFGRYSARQERGAEWLFGVTTSSWFKLESSTGVQVQELSAYLHT